MSAIIIFFVVVLKEENNISMNKNMTVSLLYENFLVRVYIYSEKPKKNKKSDEIIVVIKFQEILT